MSQTNAQWWAANFGTAPPAPSTPAAPAAPAPSNPAPSSGGGGGKVYGSQLATGIAQSYGVNPNSLVRDTYGGVSAPAMTQAIHDVPTAAPTPQPVNPYAQQLAAAQKMLQRYQSELAQAQQTQYTTPAVTPTSVTPTPNPITSPVTTTGVQSATAEQPKSTDLGIPKGSGGFTFSGGAPGAGAIQSVSPDATYNLWKTMNGGKDNPQMQQYFNSGDWASVASGNIPMWMSADPVWRSFLTRLGYMTPSFDTNMQNAIKNRLAALQKQAP